MQESTARYSSSTHSILFTGDPLPYFYDYSAPVNYCHMYSTTKSAHVLQHRQPEYGIPPEGTRHLPPPQQVLILHPNNVRGGFKQMRKELVRSPDTDPLEKQITSRPLHRSRRGRSHSQSSLHRSRAHAQQHSSVPGSRDLISSRPLSCEITPRVAANLPPTKCPPNYNASHRSSARQSRTSLHMKTVPSSEAIYNSPPSMTSSHSSSKCSLKKEDLEDDVIWRRWPWQDERKCFVVLLSIFVAASLALVILLICVFTAIYSH